MLIRSLSPRATAILTLGMGAILSLCVLYYAFAGAWWVVIGAALCAAALTVVGLLALVSGVHPSTAVMVGACVTINIGAVVGIVSLSTVGAVWLAPLVFVNYLIAGARAGSAVTVLSVATVLLVGRWYVHPHLAVNVAGAVALSLLMAASWASAVQAHFSELQTAALHDPLTGLLNRRAFEAALQDQLSMQRFPLSVVVIDLDHFKEINDRSGHPVDDAVLQRFAEVGASQLRATDHLYRVGGDEFVVLLNASADAGAKVADKILRAVNEADWTTDRTVTVTVGIATAASRRESEQVVRRADRALYAAKREGRNRCAVYDAERGIRVAEASG